MKKRIVYIVIGFIAVLFLLPVALWTILWSSTPKHHEQLVLKGLKSPVTVTFDAKGVPSIKAETIEDALYVQGYVVARERLFQMDLLRRQSAGRLSEIVGDKGLVIDKTMRFYGLEKVADDAVVKMDPKNRARIEAYAAGVNAFIEQGPLPWETKLLGYKPLEWKPRDTVLVALNLYNTLNHPTNEVEFAWGLLYEKLPKEVVDFLTPEYGFFDAPNIREITPPALPKVPSIELINVRSKTASVDIPRITETRTLTGSNAWAVAGTRTKSGKPLLSGDPHIRHMVPNIWYRHEIVAKDFYVLGVSFPGIPGVVIGSNKNTAWSFTTPAVDNVDYIPIQRGNSENTYIAYGKEVPFQMRSETFAVKKKDAISETIRETIWGPIKEFNGKEYALQWAARDPEVLKELDVFEIDSATNVEESLKAVRLWAGPPQNFMVADKDGNIAWALVGRVPKKTGMDGRVPQTRDEAHDWRGYYDFEDHPKVKNPPEGYIANGNQRQVAIDENTYKWGSNWMLSPRAYRIEEVLKGAKEWTVENTFALQNDVVSHTHLWYRDRLIEALQKMKETPVDKGWQEAVENGIKNFDGKLEVNSAAYPFLKRFRFEVLSELIGPIVVGVVPKAIEGDMMELLEKDTPIKVMLAEQPMHLLSSKYKDYNDCLVQIAVKLAKEMVKSPESFASLRWGDVNRAVVRHPISPALPKFVSQYLDMPESELSGDELVPRVNKPNHGASIRMSVDLADFAKSIYNHPGGQSGQLLSKNYGDEYADWVEGKPSSFIPGAVEVTEKYIP